MVVSATVCAEIGYFCVPVADLIAAPFAVHNKSVVASLYNEISIAPERHKESCHRIHQGIFNEQVTILEYRNHQIYIELTNCFSLPVLGSEKQSVKAWTYEDWIISEKDLKQHGVGTSVFPPALHYLDTQSSQRDIITLLVPWYDSVTETTYSAGTRFCIYDSISYDDEYTIFIYDARKKSIAISVVPHGIALVSNFKDRDEQRKAFVELLYFWCSLDGDIPYVWGGTSFLYTCQNNDAALEHGYDARGNFLEYWNRPGFSRPYAGFDASSLLLRAAQIVGIPFFCINSTTLTHYLQPIQPGEMLQEGDIIYAPGYVGIVGDMDRNELIEAQGYARGYGKVHVVPLKKDLQILVHGKIFYIVTSMAYRSTH